MVSSNHPRFQYLTTHAPRMVGVHVLSEHIFCPRSAALALEMGDDDGEEEPALGPRLPGFEDFDEHRFVAVLQLMWGSFRLWATLLAPALVVPFVIWRLLSPLAGLAACLPLFYVVARLWDNIGMIAHVVRERAMFEAAQPTPVDVESALMREINWWSLRKHGFECDKPVEPHRSIEHGLVGRPWRVLSYGILRIPVMRKHRGERMWRPKHIVRIAAYCRLIENCEAARAPFGVLLYGGSYNCVIIPNTTEAQTQLDRALKEVREFLRIQEEEKFLPPFPNDSRCDGCHWGEPRVYIPGVSETVVNGNPLVPLQTRVGDKGTFHSPCGDRFRWVPPHVIAVELGIAERPR